MTKLIARFIVLARYSQEFALRFSTHLLQAFLLLNVWIASNAVAAISEEDLLPVDEAFIPTLTAEDDVVAISFKIAPGYYLYQERLSLEPLRPDELTIAALDMPKGEPKEDEFFGKMHIYRTAVQGTAKLQFPNTRPAILAFRLKYQGCADAGVCYPPQTRTIAMDMPAVQVSGVTEALPTLGPAPDAAPPTLSNDPLGITSAPNAQTAVLGAQADLLPEDQAFIAEAIALTPDQLLLRIRAPADYYLYRNKFKLAGGVDHIALQPQFPAAQRFNDPEFGDVEVYFGSFELPIKLLRGKAPAETIDVGLEFQGCKKDSVCYPIMRRVLRVDLPVAQGLSSSSDIAAANAALASMQQISAPKSDASTITAMSPESGTQIGLISAILLAILGGILLNLMPCVLPVLSLKVLGLAESAHSKQAARQQANWYTAGVLLSFLAIGLVLIALKQAGSAFGWGLQLQHPMFVSALAMLMFVMGLNLSGVVSFGGQLAQVGSDLANADGRKGAFFNGVLACIVATPCTGPFMFTALSYAFTQTNSLVALLVLLALGFGLALPFLLIGYLPQLASRLPKPGAWMESLKQWLAFPLYGTAIWLLWVFGNQSGIDGAALLLGAMLFAAAACWWWEKQRYSTADSTVLARAFALLLALIAVLAMSYAAMQRVLKPKVPFTESQIDEQLQLGNAVFVDVTADWCITCKVNERNAIYIDAVQTALKKNKVHFMQLDYTNADPVISNYLARFKAVGVPLYVMYPAPGAKQKTPFVLPQLLTPSIVLDAITKATER